MIIESKSNYKISFNFNGQDISFSESTVRDTIGSVVDWLYDKGYKFDGHLHNSFSKKLLSLDDIKNNTSSKYYLSRMRQFYKLKNVNKYIQVVNKEPAYKFIKEILNEFGVNMLKSEGFGENDIKPIKSTEPSESPEKIKSFSKFFHTPDETEDDYILSDLEKNLNKSPKPQPYSKIVPPPTDNPFKQAICIIGESGVGKSYTTEEILKGSGHHYEFIIPTSATTGLLAQFSPNNSRYTTSRLGKMLIEAADNPDKFYTAVFDECHKNSTIEMINDELLQAISTKRNRYRFISLDNDTSQIYKDSNLEVERGNIKIPDNFGFIFISSKPKVIARNEDFFNRVDIVIIDRNMKNIEDLKTISPEDKLKLKRES
jgi:hypothetical protein